MNDVAWIAVDWGTSHLRAWLMRFDGRIVEQRQSDSGMADLTPDGFEPALQALCADVLPRPVLACGMVGSKQGWAEAPYAEVPCMPFNISLVVTAVTEQPTLSVRILSGIKQSNPADVMRGEETQIAGYLSVNPEFDGVICLPGTHTKWVHVSAGEIVSFRTAMTGELFGLLSTQSVLRHSMGKGWDASAFLDSVDTAISRPESLAAELFSLRAKNLLNELDNDAARSRLSGLLIGAELASMRPYWLGQKVAIIGVQNLSQAYEAALIVQRVPVVTAFAEDMTVSGLVAAYSHIYGDRV